MRLPHWLGWILLLVLVGCNSTDVTPVPAPPGPDDPTPAIDQVFSTGYVKNGKPRYGVMHFSPRRFQAPVPDSFSWEDQGFSTPVRNQGNCGSCWAFGGTQTIEMGYKIFAHESVDFSEQDLVGKLFYGCNGGDFVGDFQVAKGQADEASCPYTASNHKCSDVKPAGKGVRWGMVGQSGRSPSVVELQNAIQAYGAIAVTVGANSSFMNYKGGLSTSCPHSSVNHIVALTGWKTANGKVYFHLKNSWGTSWGEKGYGWFPAGCYSLADEASWLAVDKVPCPPPAVKMPAEIILNYGDDVVLAVKNLPGVTYSWWKDKTKIADGPELEMTAQNSFVVTLKASNMCGDAEIQSQVTVRNP